MTDIPFILLVQATVKPEFLEQVLKAASDTLNHTIKETGCVAFYQTAFAENPLHLCFFEHFASENAHAYHMAQSYTKAFFEILEGKLLEAPVIQRLLVAHPL